MKLFGLGKTAQSSELRRYERFLSRSLGRSVASVMAGDDRGRKIRINAYQAPDEVRTVAVFTVGLSEVVRGPSGPVELILLVNDEVPAAVDAVNGVVSLVADHPEALILGSVFHASETMGAIATTYSKPAMVLTTAESVWPALAHVETGGEPIHLLALIAVTAREAAFAQEHGIIEFERIVTEAATVDVSDLSRPSLV